MPLRHLKPRTTLTVLMLSVLLAACSVLEILEPSGPDTSEATQEDMEQHPLKYLNKRNLKPMPVKPITVSSQCSKKDEAGTRTQLKLKVKESKVSDFSAFIAMKQGDCRFDLKDFKQTATLPQVVLTHRDREQCTVRMWTQDRQVTVAYNDCAQACTGESFDYLWPTLVDSRTGRCD